MTFILIICLAIFMRWAISLNSYSGANNGPLFGDYEAQRHWMEITYNLPIKDWYINTTKNDLNYWGLDYPPLTAYHSWICGFIQSKINSSWVELYYSRGLETQQHKLFMRYSVFIMDILIYIPSLIAYFGKKFKKELSLVRAMNILLALLYPGLILIDHGHFQYNCVSLGLKIWAVFFLLINWNIIGSIFFVLSLNYKQMELYHSIPFFCYLLGQILQIKDSFGKRLLDLLLLSLIVVFTFFICWFPFLSSKDDIFNVLKRIFPIGRGLFEDKVANFWCSISVIIKLKNLFNITQIIRICSVVTLLSVLPSSINLLRKPSIMRFKYSLFNCSLAFFLFSYHVHEKTILLPASSILLLLRKHPLESVWFLLVSTFSMMPLFVKDGLILPFISSSVLYWMIFEIYYSTNSYKIKYGKSNSPVYSLLMRFSLFGCWCIGITLFFSAPTRFPHIYIMIHSIYCCGHFLLFLIYFNWCQLVVTENVKNSIFTQVKNKIS